jgi:putative hydrolase of the HAD superfamily
MILSFDLDGTLVNHDFSTAVWREAIPALVAEQRGMDIPDAKEWVFGQYDSVGEGSLEWYDLTYWYDRFGLREDWQETLRRHRPLIRLFPEVRGVLRALGRVFPMIVLSNASHPFLREEMACSGLDGLFQHAVSATSDWGQVKKTRSFYQRVCAGLNLDPRRLVHVGDHWEFDYLAPRDAGIEAYFLDRSGSRDGPGVVRDLAEFARRVGGVDAFPASEVESSTS